MFNIQILENALYLLALLNPASKVMFLSSYDINLNSRQIFELSWKSSAAALIILCVLSSIGELALRQVFRVELYSLRISGGIVVFMIAWSAIYDGRFFRQKYCESNYSFTDISLVPLAAPLIAGPGTIAAAIAITAESGRATALFSLLLAIGANFIIMLFSASINRFLIKTHLLGPLIRLTGLIIATISVQMIITGFKESKLFL